MVLPLPLAAFEEYLLADDRPGYPMNCFLRLRFRGGLDCPARGGRRAGVVWPATPCCRLLSRPAGRNRWQWAPVAVALPAVRWLDRPVGEGLPRVGPIDIRQESGLRVWAVGDRDRTDVTVQLHHVACDGMATLGFVAELLHGYAERIGVTGLPPLPPSRPEAARPRPVRIERLAAAADSRAAGGGVDRGLELRRAPPGAGGRPSFPAGGPCAARGLPGDAQPRVCRRGNHRAAPLGQGVGGAVERPAGPRPVSGPRGPGAGNMRRPRAATGCG